MHLGDVHSLGEVLPEQAVGVLLRTPLPGTLWITEVNLDIRVEAEALVIRHL